MKKYLFVSLFVIIFSFLFSACNQTTTTAVTTTKTTVTEPGSDGFLISKQIVVKGNTIWGFSEKAYGAGFQWRDIIAQNLFLQQPGRVYYDDSRKMWIAKIYPGEVVKIGNEVITPSCSIEETVTTTTKESPIGLDSVSWWGWLAVIGVLAFFVWLFGFYRPGFLSNINTSNSSSAVHVNIRNGIDLDTRRTLLERDQDFRDGVLDIIDRDAKRKGRLGGFIIDSTQERFFVATGYHQRGGGRKNRRLTEKKKNDEPKNDAGN